MNGTGFVPAMVRGLIVAGGIAVAAFLSLLFVGFLDEETAAGFLIFSSFAALGQLLVGAAVLGALIGLAAGRDAGSWGAGSGAGAVAALVGHILFAVAVIAGVGVASDAGDDEDSVGWGDFGKMLLFVVPAGVAGAVGGLAAGFSPTSVPGAVRPQAAITRPLPENPMGPGPATAPPPAAAAGARTLACPRCKHTVTVSPGQKPVCSNCGFGA